MIERVAVAVVLGLLSAAVAGVVFLLVWRSGLPWWVAAVLLGVIVVIGLVGAFAPPLDPESTVDDEA